MSSDIHSVLVGETWRKAGMVAKASGSAITAGTANYYLKCLTGDNVGKWWKNSDQTWDVSETANAMTHQADGSWTITLAASPFVDGVMFLEYAKESGNLHVAGEGRLLRGTAVSASVEVAGTTYPAVLAIGVDGGSKSEIERSDESLVLWRFEEAPLVRLDETFGSHCYDPDSKVWRHVVHDVPANTIIEYVGPHHYGWTSRATAATYVTFGWGSGLLGVPTLFYEASKSRPWIMFLRAGTPYSIYMLTAAAVTDGGHLTWEAKDPDGNAFTDPIIAVGTGDDWDVDATGIDHGGPPILVDGVIYFQYNTINNPRKSGYSTCPFDSNWQTWTKSDNNPVFSPVEDYADKDHDGTPGDAYGFFCGTQVYWPEKDGTDRFVFYVCHYSAGAGGTLISCYKSPTPRFLKTERTWLGDFHQTGLGALTQVGRVLNSVDTLNIYTADMRRDVTAANQNGDDIVMTIETRDVNSRRNQAFLIHNRAFADATVSGIEENWPLAAPLHGLGITEANTAFLLLPGLTKTVRDWSGNDIHCRATIEAIEDNGAVFSTDLVQNTIFYDQGSGGIDALKSIRTNWTVEFCGDLATVFGAELRYQVDLQGGSTTTRHFSMYVNSGTTLYFSCTDDTNTVRTQSFALGTTLETGVTYDFAVQVDSGTGKIYAFFDGVPLNSGGTAYAHTIKDSGATYMPLGIGRQATASGKVWVGHVKAVRISDTARYPTNGDSYTPPDWDSVEFASSGIIYTRVFDFGEPVLADMAIALVTPTDTTATVKVRTATDLTDKSTTPGDFDTAGTTVYSQFWQAKVDLATTDSSATPTASAGTLDATTIRVPTAGGIAQQTRDEILDRYLDGNHPTAGTVGKLAKDISDDTNELQTDLTDGGRLDLVLDDVPTTAEFEARSVVTADYFVVGDYTAPDNAGIAAAEAAAEAVLDDTGTTGVVVAAASKTGYALSSAGVSAIWNKLTSGLTTVGSVGKWMFDNLLLKGTWTDARAAKLDNLDNISLGTGARTVTITVNDGTDPLENARVRVANGAETYVGSTNASGQITLSLDDATWTVVITKPLYTFTSITLVVDGNEVQTYGMTAESIPASDPDFVTGYLYCYDEEGEPELGAIVYLRIKSYDGYGISYDTKIRSKTSNAAGLVSFTNLQPGATYQRRRGDESDWNDVTVPEDATSPYALANVLGEE